MAQSPPISDRVRLFVTRLFSLDQQGAIDDLLLTYGTESYERDVERIRLNILNISEGNLEKVVELVKLAKYDYRDLIVAAEYEVWQAVRRAGMPLAEG